MTRGKDKRPRVVQPASLANLKSLERVRPEGMEDVQVRIYLTPAQARAWRRLSPMERGELVELALKVRESASY